MKKLFSLILVLCMVMTVCAASAESTGGLSSLFGGLMGGSGSGDVSLGSLFSDLMGGSGSGTGLGGLFSEIMSGAGNGDLDLGGLSSLFGNMMGGSMSEADLNSMLGTLLGGVALEEAATEEALTEAATEAAATEAAVEETVTDAEAAELAALLSNISEAKAPTYIKPETADAFYGTWIMKTVVMAGLELNIDALTEGNEETGTMVLKLSEEVYNLFEAGAEEAPKAITESVLKDGELTITYYSEGQPTKESFRMTDAGELCLIQTEEAGGSAEAPTYILFAKAGA